MNVQSNMNKALNLEMLTPESAPEGSRTILKETNDKMGFVPNLYGFLANSSTLMKAYTDSYEAFENSSFSPAEQQAILLTISRTNECHYCSSAHKYLAEEKANTPQEVVDAILNDGEIEDKKYAVLVSTTFKLVKNKGWISKDDVKDFVDAGFTEEQILDLIAGIAVKVMSNYMNHLTQTPVDKVFEPKEEETTV